MGNMGGLATFQNLLAQASQERSRVPLG